jgi:ribosomal protein L37E
MSYKYDIKCDRCGRFIPYKQLCKDGGGSSAFIPDSDVSYEEQIDRCASCTEKHGMATPYQSGMNWDVCCIKH